MFNIGGGELLVILLVALIVLGPNRLPGAARQVGQFVGELRRLSSGFQQELRDALDEPFDTTELDPGRAHRRRPPSRQAQLRPTSGTAVDRQRRPPAEPGADQAPADQPSTAPAPADQPSTGHAPADQPSADHAPADRPPADQAPDPESGAATAPAPVSTAPEPVPEPAPPAAAEADPTASSGPVSAAPDAPDPGQPAIPVATEDGERAAG